MKKHNSCPLCRAPIQRYFSVRIKKKKCQIEVSQQNKLILDCHSSYTEVPFNRIKCIYTKKQKVSVKFIKDTSWIITDLLFDNTYQSQHLFNLLCQSLLEGSRHHTRHRLTP